MVDCRDMAARGKIGGYVKSSRYSPLELTGAARQAFLDRFLPTDSGLSQEEVLRRGRANLKMYMARLARKSALARKFGGKHY